MKDIFEVNLTGNQGNTIKRIIEIHKHNEEFDNAGVMDGPFSKTTIRITLEYHNGKQETFEVEKFYGGLPA